MNSLLHMTADVYKNDFDDYTIVIRHAEKETEGSVPTINSISFGISKMEVQNYCHVEDFINEVSKRLIVELQGALLEKKYPPKPETHESVLKRVEEANSHVRKIGEKIVDGKKVDVLTKYYIVPEDK